MDKAIDVLDEAGARVAVSMKPPKNIESVEKQIDNVKEEKNKVVLSQQYEKAANLRDKEKNLKTKLKKFVTEWEDQLLKERPIVDEDGILEIISISTNIPVTKLNEDESQKLLDIDKVLKGAIIGQDMAITKVCNSLRRNRVGIKNSILISLIISILTELILYRSETISISERNSIPSLSTF